MLAFVGLAGRARAQEDLRFVAQRHYDAGFEAYEAGSFDAALEEFRASMALAASPNTRLMIAHALRNLGRLAEAMIEYDVAAREASDLAQREPRFEATRDAALEQREQLAPQIAELTITVEPRAEGLSVEVGERAVPAPALGVALPFDPGTFVVRARAPGYAEVTRSVTLEAGRDARVALTLSPMGTADEPPVNEAPPTTSDGGISGAGVLTLIGAGLAVVAGGVATGLFVAADARYRELVSRCDGGPCPQTLAGDVSDGRALEIGGDVAIAIAGAAAVTAVIALIVWATERPRADEHADDAQRGLRW